MANRRPLTATQWEAALDYTTSEASSRLAQLGLSDDGKLGARHTCMTEEEAKSLVREVWGMDVDARRLATEKDDTFCLDDATSRSYILKVSNPHERRAEVKFETALMRHVADSAHSIPVARALATAHGEELAVVRDPNGQERLARLLTFLYGIPLDSTTSSPLERERVGETLAKLRHATAGFVHQADDRPCAWDVRHLPALAPLLSIVSDPRQSALLHSGLERFNRLVTPRLGNLRTQVVHNDFSKSNLLVDHADPAFITGVLDFGDAVRTAIAIDVSTALLNQLPGEGGYSAEDNILSDGRDVLRGYLRHAELDAEERALLPHLVMGRVISRALITTYRADQVPDNTEYIMRNTDQGWDQLRWFLEQDPDAVSQRLS